MCRIKSFGFQSIRFNPSYQQSLSLPPVDEPWDARVLELALGKERKEESV